MQPQSDFRFSLDTPAPAVDGDDRIRVIFDVETLLLDPLPGIADSVGWAMIELGLAPTLTEMQEAGVGRRPVGEVLAALLGTDNAEIIASAYARYLAHFSESGRFRCALRADSVAILRALAGNPRFDLHYLTHLGSRDTHRLLEVYGLERLPGSIVTLEHPCCPGMRPPLMKCLVEQGAAAARDWVLLSDHPWELLAAQEIGIRSIALAYGRCDLPKLCALGPDAIAADLAEVPDLLNVLLSRRCTQTPMPQSRAVH